MSLHVLCPRCGQDAAQNLLILSDGTVSCRTCYEGKQAPAEPAQTDPAEPQPAVEASAEPAKETYTAPSTGAWQYPKDQDGGIVQWMLWAFREKQWTCQEWEGYNAFSAAGPLPDARSGQDEVCNVTVSAAGGVLSLETVAVPLPQSPWMPLREALNEINMRSPGSVFVLRECGVVVRQCLTPKRLKTGQYPGEPVWQALRMLHHDRSYAQPLLESVARTGRSDRAAVEKAYAAQNCYTGRRLTPMQAQMLACCAGFRVVVKGPTMYISPDAKAEKQAIIRASVVAGVLRAWTSPDEDVEQRRPGERWGLVRQVVRANGKDAGLSRSQIGGLLERLNALNESSSLLRYIWNEEKVFALAAFVPREKERDVERFRGFVEALLRSARGEDRRLDELRRAV